MMPPVRLSTVPVMAAARSDAAKAAASPSSAGLLVLTLSGDRIRELTRFDNDLLPRFGLPLSLPD
jgi:hypothetical protein